MGKTHDVEYFEGILKEAQEKCYKKAPSMKASHREAFIEACDIFHKGFEAMKANLTDKEIEKAAKAQEKAMKKCVKAANKIFEKLDMTESSSLQAAMLKGTIIMKATPEALAEFCEKEKMNGKLVDHLLKENGLMKDMLTNGGAANGNYTQALKIYTEILATKFPDEENEFTKVNKKVAMAVALELASPIFEFDTKIQVDPIRRYDHYEQAYRRGELDPAFPNFSIWELRHVVNCDATSDQLKWGRDMLMNYAPYITSITDVQKRYLYILETDVLTRNPTWTASPRTYQQVLSGGGKDTPNAWFGRFICKAFGIPTWGCKQPGRVGLTRWTSEGWAAMNGADWDVCEWEGVAGIDFKGEVDARAAHSSEDYYKKLVLLECLADVMDGRRGEIPEEEKSILHPLRTWRSLAIIQKALMLEPASPEKFERTGEGGVKTDVEKYLEIYASGDPDDKIKTKKGTIHIPTGCNVSVYGNVMEIPSFSGGKQLNFVGDGNVDFDLPSDLEKKTYTITVEVCTVHLKQPPLLVSIDDGEKKPIEVPYTEGEWKKTKGIEIELSGGETLSFSRVKPCLGLAIKKFMLT